MKIFLALAFAVGALTIGGGLTGPAVAGNPISALQLFTAKDIEAALIDAKSANDTLAVNCYTALLPVVSAPAVSPLPKGLGAFQLFQKARDLDRLAAVGVPDDLKVACGPLVLDAQTVMLLLAAKVGIAVPGALLAKTGLGVIGATGAAIVGAQLKALP